MLVNQYGAREIQLDEARKLINEPSAGIICVIDNGAFEAAGFCFSEDEFIEFAADGTRRLRRWYMLPRDTAAWLSGYVEPTPVEPSPMEPTS